MEKVLNLAFSIKALQLKVMVLFHFRLNALNICVCLCVTMLSPTVHSGLAEHEFGVFCKNASFESYEFYSIIPT